MANCGINSTSGVEQEKFLTIQVLFIRITQFSMLLL